MSVNLQLLIATNQHRWENMHIKASRLSEFHKTAVKLMNPQSKMRYQAISEATGVPWFAIAVIHEREADGNFNMQLAQGDPLNKVSVHEPSGRGPFFTHLDDVPPKDAFYRGALDALIDCAPHAAKWKNWSAGGTFTLLEEYNGLGYAAHGVPSAYVWSGTDQYKSGKFIKDRVYDPTEVDIQLGCAPIIGTMMALDSSIQFLEVA